MGLLPIRTRQSWAYMIDWILLPALSDQRGNRVGQRLSEGRTGVNFNCNQDIDHITDVQVTGFTDDPTTPTLVFDNAVPFK